MHTKLELYQKVTPLAHLGIWEIKLLTGEVYWNAIVKQILEIPDEQNPSQEEFLAFFTDQEALVKLIGHAQKTGGPENQDFQLRSSKGNLRWVKIRIGAGFEGDECVVLYGTIKDITEDVEMITKLAAQEEQFHQAFDFAPIGMALVNTSGGFIRVNKTLCQLMGYAPGHLLELSFQELTHPEDLEADLELMYQLLDGKIGSYQMDKRYFHQSGQIIWASLHVTLVRDKAQAPLYFVSQIKDITERKKMELDRIKTMGVISAQNNRLLNFAHIISHNLRSHTGNIQMITDMIGTEEDAAEKEVLINMLAINVANLQGTLLDLNEVVDVHTDVNRVLKPLNLLAVVRKTTEILSVSLKQTGARLVITIDPQIELDYDQTYLESIILNLLTNALKYSSTERTPEIHIRASQYCGQLILEVADNGIGINLEMHGYKVFGMYKTFHGNSDARGLGLFLVKNQVEAMGGNITVESTPGEGTKFKIEFNHI